MYVLLCVHGIHETHCCIATFVRLRWLKNEDNNNNINFWWPKKSLKLPLDEHHIASQRAASISYTWKLSCIFFHQIPKFCHIVTFKDIYIYGYTCETRLKHGKLKLSDIWWKNKIVSRDKKYLIAEWWGHRRDMTFMWTHHKRFGSSDRYFEILVATF